MSGNMNVPPPDMNQLAIIRLTLGAWNDVLRLIRTGHGDAFNWDTTNPIIMALSNQLQSQMYPPQADGPQVNTFPQQFYPKQGKPNGEGQQRRGEGREDDAGMEDRRSPFRVEDRT